MELDGNLDQWPHLKKLIQCYKTDWKKDEPKYRRYESISSFSFQNKIFEGLATGAETYLANAKAKGKTKIEDTTDDDIPSTFGRQYTEHLGESPLSSYESAFDWKNERSTIFGQRIPETYTVDGLRISVKVLSLSFQMGLVEPFYGTICLYDKERREKLSENFIFRVIPTDMQDGSTSHKPRGIFYLDAPSASVCLLIQMEKAAIEEGRWTPDPYSHKGQVPMKESEKQKRQAWSRIMPYKEPFAWAFVPLFESNTGPVSNGFVFPSCPLATSVCTSGSQDGIDEPNVKTSVVIEISNLSKIKEGYTEDSLQDPKNKVHKPMRGSLKLEIEKLQAGRVNFENASGSGNATHGYMVKKCRSNGSDKAPGNADVIANDFQAFDFRTTARNEPFLQCFHCLYVYPLTVSLSQKRNLFIRVELRKDDADTCTQPLEAMHSREPHASLQKWVHTQVAVGARTALFHDEIKVSLPDIWAPRHHLRFTFFHIDLQTKLEAPKPVVIGYASLPLSTHAQLRSDISLPIMRELAPDYLQNSVKEKRKYLEDGKSVFKLRLRLCSSLYPISEHIRGFFLQYDRHILCPSPPWESEFPKAIDGLKNADLTALLQFLHPILNMLLHIIAICVEKIQVHQ